MYNLLLISKRDVVYLEKIKDNDAIKAIKLFFGRNQSGDIYLYEYSANADYEDEYYMILHLFK